MSEEYIWEKEPNSELPAYLCKTGEGSVSFFFDEWVLVYVLQGSCAIKHMGETSLLTQETAAWAKNVSVGCAQNDKILYACLGGLSLEVLSFKGVFTKDCSISVANIIRALIASAKLGILENKWQNSSVAYDAATKCCALSQRVTVYPQLVSDTIKLINERYPYLYGVEDIAELLAVSKSHLIRLFTQNIGISPGQYLKEERLKNSVALLQSGKYSVKEVAAMVGYDGENYFCKVFKARFGISPGNFRAQRDIDKLDVSPKENIFYL